MDDKIKQLLMAKGIHLSEEDEREFDIKEKERASVREWIEEDRAFDEQLEKEFTNEEIRRMLVIGNSDDIAEEINELHKVMETNVDLSDENNNLRNEVAELKDRLKSTSEALKKMTKEWCGI